jgi:hypothetical protein
VNKYRFVVRIIVSIVFVFMASALCSAQATRTWVSGTGDDANPCSRTAPCKTFQGAISKTGVGGEINVIDSGGFGAVTITKSISIEAQGVLAGVLVSGGNGIVISPSIPPGSTVVLRGLTLEGLGGGLNGISFLGSGSLHVENCTINNFTSNGIEFNPNGTGVSQLFVKDTIIRNNAGTGGTNPIGGIYVHPQTGAFATAKIDGSRVERNAIGLRADDNSKVTVRNSSIESNTAKGVIANSAVAAVEITLDSCMIAFNSNVGVGATVPAVQGTASATIRLSNTTITGNAFGIRPSPGSVVLSCLNNRIFGNTTADGAATGTYTQQ